MTFGMLVYKYAIIPLFPKISEIYGPNNATLIGIFAVVFILLYGFLVLTGEKN